MRHLTSILIVALSAHATGVAADTPALRLELNTAETTPSACRLSFVIENAHSADIAQAVFETVLFNTDGSINQLVLFDFGALPAGRHRVRQFEVAGQPCEDLSRILINGTSTCQVATQVPDACASILTLSSRTAIALLG